MSKKNKKELKTKKEKGLEKSKCCFYYTYEDPCGCYVEDPCGCYYIDPCCC